MVAPQHRDRGKLGGLKRRQVIRLLAAEEITRSEIARRYDVSPAAITQFADKHAEEIKAVRANMDDEFAGILIAQKASRLAAYGELYEIATTPTPKISANGKTVEVFEVDEETGEGKSSMVMEVDVRAAATVLKQAAEEMGQLPTRLQVSGDMQTTTTYRIEGVDPSDLT